MEVHSLNIILPDTLLLNKINVETYDSNSKTKMKEIKTNYFNLIDSIKKCNVKSKIENCHVSVIYTANDMIYKVNELKIIVYFLNFQ